MSDNLKSGLLCLSAIGSAVFLGSVLLSRGEPQTSTKDESLIDEPKKETKKELDSSNIIEICLSDIESIHEAARGEANSIELCSNRLEGGITPSSGLIEQAVQILRATSVAVHVLIRPRAGNFVYSTSESEVIFRDILNAKKIGADGIVFGALTTEGKIDKTLMSAVRSVSEGMLLTFHRAFDMCTEGVEESLESIVALGCDRILTSGRCANVTDGIDVLKTLSQLAKGRLAIVAGCGVTTSNAYELVTVTQVQGVHAGSAVTVKKGSSAAADSSSSKSTIAFADMLEWDCVDGTKVATLVDKARRAWAGKAEVSEELSVGEEEGEEQKGDHSEECSDKFDVLTPLNSEKGGGAVGVVAGTTETVPSNLDKSYIYLPNKK